MSNYYDDDAYEEWEFDVDYPIAFTDVARMVFFAAVLGVALTFATTSLGQAVCASVWRGILHEGYFLYAVWPGAWA